MIFVFPASYLKNVIQTDSFTVIETQKDTFFIHEDGLGFVSPDGSSVNFSNNKEANTSHD